MRRPTWLRRKGKSKSQSPAAASRASSTAIPSKSELTDGNAATLGNHPKHVPQPKPESRQSLWDQAYDILRNKNKDLVDALENMLMFEPETKSMASVDGDPSKRETQMSALVDEKLAAMNEKKWRVKMCGRPVEIRTQVDRVVKVVLVAKDFISPFANLDPIHAGLPWAGVCMLLPLLVKDASQRAAAIDGLEYISQLVYRYAQIEHIYLQDEEPAPRNKLEAAITQLYTHILEYEARAARQFDRNSVHQTVRNIGEADGWDSIRDSIEKSERECDKLTAIIDAKNGRAYMRRLELILDQQTRKVDELLKASSAQDEALLAEIKAMRKDQVASFETKEERDCHKCLRTIAYENTNEKNPDRVPGTCEWFLRHPKYINWLNEKASNLLWVTADPGCGKSVLSKFLVDDYKSWMWKDTSVCYFFFKDDSEENKSATHVLCAILHQLFLQNHALLKHAMPDYDRNGNKLPLLFKPLWSILLNAAADSTSGGIVCVLDALDECSESSCAQLVNHLTEFQSNTNETTKIKFLITSRPNDFIWRTFSQKFFQQGQDLASIKLMGENEHEVEEICAEINLLIDAKMKDFKRLRSSYGIDDHADVAVKSKLDEIENRTYLWVALIFPELDKMARNAEDELLKTIKHIPATVYEAYEKILSNSSDVNQARRLLHIACAAARPLTLTEMNRALSIKDQDNVTALVPPQSFGSVVRDLCGLFVSIQNSRIYLIHQTAKEFLIRDSAAEEAFSPAFLYEGTWKHSLEPTESNLILAQICMRYLLSLEFGLSLEFKGVPLGILGNSNFQKTLDFIHELDQPNHFLAYAAEHWVTHFKGAASKQMTLSRLALELCNPQSKSFKTWFPIQWYSTSRHRYRDFPRNLTSLMIGSYLGLEEIVRLLLTRDDVDPNSKDEHDRTSFVYAAKYGNESIVKLLLERDDIDLDFKDNFRRTPLFYAAQKGYDQIVRLFLARNDVDFNFKNQFGETVLAYAAKTGQIQLVELLLTRDDVDPDLKADRDRTPLSYAAKMGHVQIMELLLARDDVNLNSKDCDLRTPLSYAAEWGHDQIMKLLLARDDVNLNSKDRDLRTPLSYAAQMGRGQVVKLLLARDDVDLNSKDHDLRTPLSYAAQRGNDQIVKLLLARDDVDPNSQDNYGTTPLQLAEFSHRFDVAELLRAKLASIASAKG